MTAGDWRARAGTVFTLEKQPATASRGMVVNGVSEPVARDWPIAVTRLSPCRPWAVA